MVAGSLQLATQITTLKITFDKLNRSRRNNCTRGKPMTLITNLSLVFHKTGYRPGKNRFYKHAPIIAWFYQIVGPYSYFCEEIATPGKVMALIPNPALVFTDTDTFNKTVLHCFHDPKFYITVISGATSSAFVVVTPYVEFSA
jgi:hypothetical protein